MTRYQGLYCIIVAGYENQMTRYFLPSNEGMDRRFPYKFVLRDAAPEDLLVVFQRQLLMQQGIPVPDGPAAALESANYFGADAWSYLTDVIRESTRGQHLITEEEDSCTGKTYRRVKVFIPTYEHMYSLFEYQAGSMANLAAEAVTVLLATISFSDVPPLKGDGDRPTIPPQTRQVMRAILVRRICNVALSFAEEHLRELVQVETELGIRW